MTTVRTAKRRPSAERGAPCARTRPVPPWWALLLPVPAFALLLLTLLVSGPSPVPGERPGGQTVTDLLGAAARLLADPP